MRGEKLLTAFTGTSSELLIKEVTKCDTLFLTNDKIKNSANLIELLSNKKYEYVIALGQRPNIKNKVHIETTARKGEFSIRTKCNCEKLRELFINNGVDAKISHNAGTSFCNEIYWNGLKYIDENKLDTKMVFIHVPFMKNIEEFEVFKNQILTAFLEV